MLRTLGLPAPLLKLPFPTDLQTAATVLIFASQRNKFSSKAHCAVNCSLNFLVFILIGVESDLINNNMSQYYKLLRLSNILSQSLPLKSVCSQREPNYWFSEYYIRLWVRDPYLKKNIRQKGQGTSFLIVLADTIRGNSLKHYSFNTF